MSAVQPLTGTIRISATADGATLDVAVDPATHVIIDAHHDGADATLDVLCGILPGLPVQEAADHGVHRLMARLFDANTARPVAGVVLPQNAGPAYARPLVLLRSLLAAYRRAVGYSERENMFVAEPASAWSKLDPSAKAAAATAVIAEAGLGASLVRLERNILHHELRVVIAFDDTVPAEAKPAIGRALERRLTQALEPQIEIYNEELKDRNAIRRL